MPGANQLAIFDHAFGQRAAPVGTFVIQGADHSIDVGNTQCPRAGTEFLGLPGGAADRP